VTAQETVLSSWSLYLSFEHEQTLQSAPQGRRLYFDDAFVVLRASL
jgi:hypothetical protein